MTLRYGRWESLRRWRVKYCALPGITPGNVLVQKIEVGDAFWRRKECYVTLHSPCGQVVGMLKSREHCVEALVGEAAGKVWPIFLGPYSGGLDDAVDPGDWQRMRAIVNSDGFRHG